MTLLRLTALALTALILIPSGAHLFELPAKIRLDREAYLTVQGIYAGWAWFGVPLLAAAVANGALAFIERRSNLSAARAALISTILIVVSNAVFFVWVFPANRATANWTLMPANWESLRQQWEYGHAITALIAFVALLMTGWAIIQGHQRRAGKTQRELLSSTNPPVPGVSKVAQHGFPIMIRHLRPADVPLLKKLNALFGEVFSDPDTYGAVPPSDVYLETLLAKDHVIALAAVADHEVLGGLVAYELDKFERARREVYIYDLAVRTEYRRKGVATALIQHLREVATRRGAWVIYVQADYGDAPAVALYEKLGTREEVLHYDIEVAPSPLTGMPAPP